MTTLACLFCNTPIGQYFSSMLDGHLLLTNLFIILVPIPILLAAVVCLTCGSRCLPCGWINRFAHPHPHTRTSHRIRG